VAYIHIVLGGETLDVEVGRSLVFEGLVDHSVILLFISSTQASQSKTHLCKFTSPSRPLPLEVGIVLVSIVYILEPIRQLVCHRVKLSLHDISPASS
jgi:hypothetical protein